MSQFFDADLQLLMNQLRQNEANSFSWEELAKLAKMNFMEKRNPLDSEDRSRIQRGLEFLKRHLKVCSYKDLCDVLSSICARVNLKFCVAPASACGDLIPAAAGAQFLSISNAGENFGVKITPSSSSTNNETLVEKVQLFFPDKSCHGLHSLCKILNRRTLNPAEEYLSTLSSKFSFNDQKDVNLHIFQALKSLEHQLESYDKNKPVFELVNNKDTGLFQPRADGSFGRLHFFVHPREMISESKRDFWTPTVDVKFTFRNLMCETEADVRIVGEPKMTPLSEMARKNMRQFLCLCLTMRAVVERVIGTDKCSGDALTSSCKKRKFVDVR